MFTYPVVPEVPLVLKLSWLLVESKESADIVEFDVTEKKSYFLEGFPILDFSVILDWRNWNRRH